ncbi:hypothetical protein FA13DRAFT_1751609 [Coprinellus micaceus]|uniref:Uncharacterized protein n=1 Tax=Coprinellus micaceus TaxID=71717 RepID=A0A4Y7U035_COPMI|nr:hypothetical protein FA13DRAFT_1751609 [Coprinellus micaceus]
MSVRESGTLFTSPKPGMSWSWNQLEPGYPHIIKNGRNVDAKQTFAPGSSLDTKELSSPASYVVISGGTGGNAICSAFGDACFVLPVSDDGGSSSEIIRVLGGPSVGEIIEGRSPLWKGIPNDRKETIRGFLVYFESELLKRAQKNFDFRNGSIGNYFIAGAQGFFRSLPSAIFLFSSITNSQAHILPVIVTNHTVTIAAELGDGQRLIGQCEISHPVATRTPELTFSLPDELSLDGMSSLAEPQSQNIMYEQDKNKPFEPLPERLSRLYYINSYGMEIHPSPNPDFLANLRVRNVLDLLIIMPCLALRGVAGAIASSRTLQAKVLLLNAENDRETEGYTAVDYINAIVGTLNTNYSVQQYGLGNASTTYPASAFITDLVHLKGGKRLGINCIEVTSMMQSGTGLLRFDAETVRVILARTWAERQEGSRTP